MAKPELRAELETFREFKASFYYGSRTDLLFKWLERLPDDQGAEFLAGVLRLLDGAIDNGDVGPLLEHVYEWNVRAYRPDLDHHEFHWSYDDSPFTPMAKPLAESRLALFTSSGHFVEGDDPEPFGVRGMTQEEAAGRIKDFGKGEPQLSTIPSDTPVERLVVRHGGYDVRAARKDANTVFPIERLREFQQEGVIGELAPNAYSFVGATSQIRLKKKFGPEWAQMLKDQAVDAVLLVPV